MSLHSQLSLLAVYNRAMNAQVYAAAAQLSPAELQRDRGAYFASIIGTLNHIMVGDTIWLQRFAAHPDSAQSLRQAAELPTPPALDAMLFAELPALWEQRRWLDDDIVAWVEALPERALGDVLAYRDTRGRASRRNLGSLIVHFFNHQTHHRGQVSTLLSQAGQDVGVTDFLQHIPEETTT